MVAARGWAGRRGRAAGAGGGGRRGSAAGSAGLGRRSRTIRARLSFGFGAGARGPEGGDGVNHLQRPIKVYEYLWWRLQLIPFMNRGRLVRPHRVMAPVMIMIYTLRGVYDDALIGVYALIVGLVYALIGGFMLYLIDVDDFNTVGVGVARSRRPQLASLPIR